MRLTADIWVKAYLRRCASAGVDALVARRGDDYGGAIHVKVRALDGTATVYGPAPSFGGERDGNASQPGDDRRFNAVLVDKPECDVDAWLARQADFDGDIWVVEVDDRRKRHFLDEQLVAP